jgi:transposase
MGCDRAVDDRAEQNGSAAQDLYAVDVGCDPVHCDDGMPMGAVAEGFSALTTVQYYFYYFYRLRDGGVLDLINEALVEIARRFAGREPQPTAAIIDGQLVKTTESGGPRGFDAGKKIKGRKRHIVTDTQGNLLCGIVHAADVQDRDGAPAVVSLACASYPTIAHLFADGGYAGENLENALHKIDGPAIEIVRRPDGATGFIIVARRWSWNARSHGSTAAGVWPRIRRPPSLRLKHGSLWPLSDCWPDASPEWPTSSHEF